MWIPFLAAQTSLRDRILRATPREAFAFHVPGPDVLFVYLDMDDTPHVFVRRTGALHNRLALHNAHVPQIRELWHTLDRAIDGRVDGANHFEIPANGSPLVAGRLGHIVDLRRLQRAIDAWIPVDAPALYQAMLSASALEGVAAWLAMVDAHDGRTCLLDHAAAWRRRGDPVLEEEDGPPQPPATAGEDALAKVVLGTENDCAATLREYIRLSGAGTFEDLASACQAMRRAASVGPESVYVDRDAWNVFCASLDRLVVAAPGPAEPLEADEELAAPLAYSDEEESLV